MRQYLYSNRFQGIIGNYTFDKNGDISGVRQILMRIHDGQAEVLKESLDMR